MKAFMVIVIAVLVLIFGGTVIRYLYPPVPVFQSVSVPSSSTQSNLVVVILINLEKLPAFPQSSNQSKVEPVGVVLQDWTNTCLIEAAKKRGFDVKVIAMGDIEKDDKGYRYQCLSVELPMGCDVYDAVQKLILIDFVVLVGSDTHQATKTDRILEIK